eukprot:2742010-Prymnesium_polylepis.1
MQRVKCRANGIRLLPERGSPTVGEQNKIATCTWFCFAGRSGHRTPPRPVQGLCFNVDTPSGGLRR